jgi:protein-L-isoaspartate(D-aspartate) O-methyltransferase
MRTLKQWPFPLQKLSTKFNLVKEFIVDHQTELLREAQQKYSLSREICMAYEAIPRHEFITTFSADHINWLPVTPANYVYIYNDTTLLLHDKEGQTSTLSQPSFVLKMLEILDLHKGMKVFELGTGSGWNAALMGYLVGKQGKVTTYEIIPEMVRQAKAHLAKFDLPQVEVIEGDALEEIWELEDFDRGIFTAAAWDLPSILFDVVKEGGKIIFILKTSRGDVLLAMKKEKDHFRVYERLPCRFPAVTSSTLGVYFNDLSELYSTKAKITIWPQGTLDLGDKVVVGRDMVFKLD